MPITIRSLELLAKSGTDGGFVESNILYDKLQAYGFSPEQIDFTLLRSTQKHLIETSARRIPIPGQESPHSIRVTNVGVYHVLRLSCTFTYVDAMIVDTPIFDKVTREKIMDVAAIEARLERALLFINYLDERWNDFSAKPSTVFDWVSNSNIIRREITEIKFRLQHS